jgi:hypothetical protein
MDIKHLAESKKVRGILIGIAGTLVVLGVFGAGIAVGSHKARFSENLGAGFERNFVGGKEDFFMGFSDRSPMPGGHGAVGTVVGVAYPKVVVAGPDNIEKTVVLRGDTLVRKFREEGTTTDVVAGTFVVVLGNPDSQGQIEAKLVRIVPAPGTMATGTMPSNR